MFFTAQELNHMLLQSVQLIRWCVLTLSVIGYSPGIAAMFGIQPSDDKVISTGVLLQFDNPLFQQFDPLVPLVHCGPQLTVLLH